MVVLVLVDVEVDVLVDVDVVVVDVLVLVEVEVLVLVLVVVNVVQSQLFPLHLHHAFCNVSQYSSPISGFVGGTDAIFIFPSMLVACVIILLWLYLYWLTLKLTY